MSRLVLILVVGGFFLYGMTNLMLNKNITRTTEVTADNYSYANARNIANSVAQMALSKLADNSSWRVTTPATINLLGGSATYTVVDVTSNSNDNSGDGEDHENGDDHSGEGSDNSDHSGESVNGISNQSGLASLINLFNKDINWGGWYADNNNGNGHSDDGGGEGGDGEGDSGDGHNNSNSNQSTQIKISVTAEYNSVTKNVIVYAEFPQAAVSVPKFMSYALLTQNSISINGNVNIVDDNNTSWNANVHTNSNFSMNGNNTIKGFLTYVGSAHSNPSWRLNSQITPNKNPNNDANYSQSNSVDIPTFNPADYKNIATTVYNTNVNWNNKNISLGTKDKPEIIYINGDLSLNGNVSGYGVFIVKGNINLNGNVTINGENPNESNLGLYTSGNINANGNITIKAQILANQNVNLNGNVNIYGSVTSGGTVNMGGKVSINYKPATTSLTSPFWKGDSNGSITDNFGFAKKRLVVTRWLE